jgi:hypothetical protein
MTVTAAITVWQEPLGQWLRSSWGFRGDVTEYMIYPAVLASVLCLVVVSLLTPPPPEEKWRPFIDQPRGA